MLETASSVEPWCDPALAQQEQLRQQYLAALGVDCWLPRQALPGAAPSPQWQWQSTLSAQAPQPAVAPSGSDTVAEEKPASRPKAGQPLRALLDAKPAATSEPVVAEASIREPAVSATSDVGLKSASTAAASLEAASMASSTQIESQGLLQAKAVADTPEQSAGSEDARGFESIQSTAAPIQQALENAKFPSFRLMLLGFGEYLVVTELPSNSSHGWSEQHRCLLVAVLRAISAKADTLEPDQLSEFSWPLDPMASFDQSEAIARRALAIEVGKFEQPERNTWLLMGQAALRCVSDQVVLEPGQLHSMNARRVLAVNGLNEVLRIPGLKAELWQQLQPLRQPK